MYPPRIGLAFLVGLLLSACSPAVTTTPSPLPSVPMCTPEFGGEEFPCTQQEFELQQQLDARYAEAERVLRRNAELENEMYHAQTGTVPPEASALYDPDGPYASHMAKVVEVAKDVRVEGDFEVTGVSRTPILDVDAPGTIALVMCIDGSRTVFHFPDGHTEVGSSGAKKTVLTESPTSRIWNVYDAEDSSC